MTRTRVVSLLAAILALAAVLTACGDGGGEAQGLLDDATLEGVDSGVIDLSMAVDVPGEDGGSFDASLSGPFENRGEEQAPNLDLTASVHGSMGDRDLDFDGGLVLLPRKAFVNFKGTDYEVDPISYGFVEGLLKEGQGGKDAQGQADDCREAAGALELGEFVEDPVEGAAVRVGGADTTKVSGELDVAEAFDALIGLAEDPACQSQLGPGGPGSSIEELEQRRDSVEESLKSARIDLYVGEDDIVRRLTANLLLKPDQPGEAAQHIDLDLTLTGVNEKQQIAAPKNAKPIGDLFLNIGLNPLDLAGAAQEGIGELIERLGTAVVGKSLGGGSSSGGGRGSYYECLQEVTTPADVLRCGDQLE